MSNYAVKADVVCLQVTLCDPHLSALEVRFLRRGAIQIYVYLYLYLQVVLYCIAPQIRHTHDVGHGAIAPKLPSFPQTNSVEFFLTICDLCIP